MKRLRDHLILFSATLAGCCLLLYFCTPYKEQIGGVLLGLLVSLYNVLFMEKKLRIMEERAKLSKMGNSSRGTGMLHRFSIIALAMMMAYKYPQYIDARMMILGLPLCYIFLFVEQWLKARKEIVSFEKGVRR